MVKAIDYSLINTLEAKETLDKIRHPIEIAILGNNDDASNYFNTGSIIRSCHSFLVRKIYLINREKFYTKASMGCHRWENIVFHNIEEFIEEIKDKTLISFERNPHLKTENLFNFQYPKNSVLLFGTEKFGIPKELLEKSCHIVSIPMFGLNNDLNLSVAVGIVLYDFLRKYYEVGKK